MLKEIVHWFFPPVVLYVELREQRLRVTRIDTGEVFDEPPLVAIATNTKGVKTIVAIGAAAQQRKTDNITVVINPFFHPRVLVADFQVGEKLLQHAFKTLLGHKLFLIAPVVVMHQLEKTEGGVTEVEKRAIRELALGAGGREIWIYEGGVLSRHGFNLQEIKAREHNAH